MGHEVHMFELAPAAVQCARTLQASSDIPPIHSIDIADARNIDRADESADLVLLMGPSIICPKRRNGSLHCAKL
ncbi:hypothetical protein PaeBR_05835 [Paenibacillus sp. BR2-3]|uniref:hypothetical protein n=1 Tax=Paenibacillus sp. BR2-3 TaxID=3048494 RepID=UPI003977AB30